MPVEERGANLDPTGVDIAMVRTDMDNLPVWTLPAGFRLRNYRDGDRQTWLDVQADEPMFTVTGEHFDDTFGAHPAALYDRLFFVEESCGQAIGSIAAWWNDSWDEPGSWGQIHWVAMRKAWRGQGLAKPMMVHALRRIAQDHGRAMLDTNTAPVWAIKVYLDCGFVPDAHSLGVAEGAAAWHALQAKLNHPALAHTLAGHPGGRP